ncbi:hypothetical protein EC988_000079 [Linderina pennispora]|nr:hypothetical protein EC988_000079 [Linderina pennispora]
MTLGSTRKRFNTILRRKERLPLSAVIDNSTRASSTDGSTAPSNALARTQMVGSATSEDIFVVRMTAWRRLVKLYETYYQSIVAAEKAAAKNLEKALGEFAVPLQGEHFFLGVEHPGVQNIASQAKSVHGSFIAQQMNLVQTVETETIEGLGQLRTEIKDNIKLYADHMAPLYKRLRRQVREAEQYKEKLARTIDNLPKDMDAWLAQQQVRRELRYQAECENALFRGVQAEHTRLVKWEAGLAERLTRLVTTTMRQQRSAATANQQVLDKFLGYMDTFDAKHELGSFETQFGAALRNPMGLDGTSHASKYDYMYKNHEYTDVLLEGPLEREKGVVKKFHAQYAVLTKLGFLHCFADQLFLLETDPEASFFLRDCSVGPLDDNNNFTLFLSDKVVGRSRYVFRSHDREVIRQWWSIIDAIIRSTPSPNKDGTIVGGSLRDPETAARAIAISHPNTMPTASGLTASELAARNLEEDNARRSMSRDSHSAGHVLPRETSAPLPPPPPPRTDLPSPQELGEKPGTRFLDLNHDIDELSLDDVKPASVIMSPAEPQQQFFAN